MRSVASRSLAGPAAGLFVLLVLYASLYPFDDWRWPPGRGPLELLALPWPPYRVPFDIVANLAGYLPMGLLVGLAVRDRGGPAWHAVAVGLLLPSGISYAAEVAQHFLPGRHPSLMDWTLNTGGALAGALLVLPLHAFGWPQRLEQGLRRWFDPDAVGAMVLLALWPVALLFPAPVALGLGQVGPRLEPLLASILEGVPWAEPWHNALLVSTAAGPPAPLGLAAETMVTALGLLAPCLLAFAVVPPGWRRVGLALSVLGLTGAVMTLSTALNFGPQHALAWLAPSTLPGLVLGAAAAVALAWLPRRLEAGCGLIVLTALVVMVARAPADPYFAQNLSSWEQGRFIRFHGLAQWIGWLWPFGAQLWLLTRIGARR